jgi:hypothetical protein
MLFMMAPVQSMFREKKTSISTLIPPNRTEFMRKNVMNFVLTISNLVESFHKYSFNDLRKTACKYNFSKVKQD